MTNRIDDSDTAGPFHPQINERLTANRTPLSVMA